MGRPSQPVATQKYLLTGFLDFIAIQVYVYRDPGDHPTDEYDLGGGRALV